MAGILLLGHVVDMSSTAPILALMLGLAVGIDYSLFISSRYRHNVATGLPRDEAAGRAVGTAGSAVVFAGLTVIIALSGLAVVGIPFLTVMASPLRAPWRWPSWSRSPCCRPCSASPATGCSRGGSARAGDRLRGVPGLADAGGLRARRDRARGDHLRRRSRCSRGGGRGTDHDLDDAIIKSMGFALAFGVLVDAFVVRLALVPAVMSFLGERAWWLPRWLDRAMPNVDIEGETLRTESGPEPALEPAAR